MTCHNRDGFRYLYLGAGHLLRHGRHGIGSAGTGAVSAGLLRTVDGLTVSADGPVRVTLPVGSHGRGAKLYYDAGNGYTPADEPDGDRSTVSGVVPAGYGIGVRVG